MAYDFQGSMFEVCTCDAICPCWIGQDPDGGQCYGLIAYHIGSGVIDGIDVSGHTFAVMALIPGNVLQGNWKIAIYLDDQASDAQAEALLNAFSGKLGGPLADQAQLIGEVISVERVPIAVGIDKGTGYLRVGTNIEAELAGLQGPTGPTTLRDSVFSTIAGSPAYVAKSVRYDVNLPDKGFVLNISGKNAVHGQFHFQA
jgi:hypothetical protein